MDYFMAECIMIYNKKKDVIIPSNFLILIISDDTLVSYFREVAIVSIGYN